MKTQKDYWNKKIVDWTKVSYDKKEKNVPLAEKIATHFRAISKRMDVTLKLLGPLVNNKTVLNLGCGLGNECFALLDFNPKRVIGIDISGVAIEEAQEKAKKRKLDKKTEFIEVDISQLKTLPEFDCVIGLGFIDYLTKDELRHLFEMIGNRPYFFSYFEKKLSLLNLMHTLYLRWQKCPGAYKYSRAEIESIVPSSCRNYILEENRLLFLTNIDELRKN
jgi:2-polyprenyl-3-methyl-5-hydroxy-6-metoxy-1,4-benzoquinol methylase